MIPISSFVLHPVLNSVRLFWSLMNHQNESFEMTHLVWLICHIIYDRMNERWNACKMHWTASPVFIIARDMMCHMISRDVTWCHVNRCILQRLWHWANTNGGFWLVPRNGSSKKIFELIHNQFSSFYQSQFSSKTSPDSGLLWWGFDSLKFLNYCIRPALDQSL